MDALRELTYYFFQTSHWYVLVCVATGPHKLIVPPSVLEHIWFWTELGILGFAECFLFVCALWFAVRFFFVCAFHMATMLPYFVHFSQSPLSTFALFVPFGFFFYHRLYLFLFPTFLHTLCFVSTLAHTYVSSNIRLMVNLTELSSLSFCFFASVSLLEYTVLIFTFFTVLNLFESAGNFHNLGLWRCSFPFLLRNVNLHLHI